MRAICSLKGVKLGKNVKFNGKCFVRRYPSSSISIGDGSFFVSSKWASPHSISNQCSFVTLNDKARIKIGKNVGGTSATITSAVDITIGDNVLLGVNTNVMDTDWHHSDPDKRHTSPTPKSVIIENNVFIGTNSVVLKGVKIGRNSIIGANSVVYGNIPENCIAIGNPCKVIMKRNWDKE
ncbi:acyltransferase [Labilibacter marinus]|uniref:acyltransferase n=1 Tax=Labilibacter marinus TaxID=1477105 RepID=UPI0013013FB4|nr:acyltransferase [Labilibacter marinus]